MQQVLCKGLFVRQVLWLAIGVFFISLCISSNAFGQTELEKIHQKIIVDHEQVEHVSAEEFIEMEIAGADIIIFDVRKKSEFAVSHLQNAIRLDPGTKADEFEQLYGEQLQGKTVVFYCSVGRRSSAMAEEVAQVIENSEAAAFNLTGGVFTWRNEERSLVSQASQSTTKVHPYNFYWGRLIEDKKAISYSPD